MKVEVPIIFKESLSESDNDQKQMAPTHVDHTNAAFDVKDLVSASEREQGMAGVGIAQTQPCATTSPRPFWGQEKFEPTYTLCKEEPQHRAICILAAQGFTDTEIAEQTGFTTVMISYVKKQPWAQTYMAELMERAGFSAVKNVLQGAALESAKTLIGIMRGYETNEIGIQVPTGGKVADRGKAANDILNRLYGVAPQTVLHGKVDLDDMSTEELQQIVLTGEAKAS